MSEIYKCWQCRTCGYIYDEKNGAPGEGIAPGTCWADVPENWSCPACGARKAEFDMMEVRSIGII